MRCLSLVVLAGSVLATATAAAQGPGGTAPKSFPTQGRVWVKICETPAAAGSDIFGKLKPIGVTSCYVQHERLAATSGALVVAAGVVQARGRQILTIKVPPGVERESGARLMMLPRDLWERVQRRERVPFQQSPRVRRLSLAFTLCAANGCLMEAAVSPQLLADLKSFGGLVIVTTRARQAFSHLVSLSGFREAYDGPPTDAAKFYAARAELLRQFHLKQGGAGGSLAPMSPGGGSGTAPRLPGGGPGGSRPSDGYGLAPPKGPSDGQGAPTAPPPPVPPVPPRRPGGGQDI
jgi:invasion protein IalB